VAARLGLRYLDTGAMYRAMTWAMLDAGIDVDDAGAVARHAEAVRIISGTNPAGPTIHVGQVDVAGPIRSDDVTGAVSAVSAVPSVREMLVAIQRAEVAAAHEAGHGIVVEGRDITSVVLPEADVRLFVTADPAVRAARRAAQDAGLGKDDVDVRQTETDLLARDAKDSTREASPLVLAPGVVVLDTSDLTLDQVVDRVCGLVADLPG
jgi:cytidylate kinase